MKRIIGSLIVVLFAITVYAQDVKDMSKTMSLGPQHCYYIEIVDVSPKVVQAEWEKYLKDSYKNIKYNKKAKQWYTESGRVPIIGGNNVTLYSKIEEGRDLVTLYVWGDTGEGFISPDKFASQSDGMRRYLSDFWIRAKKKAVSLELEKEEDKRKGMEKDFGKLEKKNKDLHDDIEKYKEKIRQAESDIEQNLKDQDTKKVEIKGQQKVIDKVIERLNSIGKG